MEASLKLYIRKHKIKQIYIANKVGLSKAFVSDWMNDKCGISVTNFELICKALGIAVNLIKGFDTQ